MIADKTNSMKYLLLLFSSILVSSLALGQNKIPDAENSSSETMELNLEGQSLEDYAASLLLEYDNIRSRNFSNGRKIIVQADLDSMSSIARRITMMAPLSFSSSYVKFKEEGFTETGYAHLKKAESFTDNKTELYSDFLASAHVLNKTADLKNYSKKLRNSGFIQSAVLEYNRNVLRSISESKAFIITNGWDDTYPLLTLLEEEKRKNVTVINTEWIYDSNYRALISSKLKSTNVSFNNNTYTWITNVVNSSNQPVYFTPTIPGSELAKLGSSISPAGILFKKGTYTAEEQNYSCLIAWKKFSKVKLVTAHPISKNYIILLTLLESTLAENANEKGTYTQILEFKESLEKKHPALK